MNCYSLFLILFQFLQNEKLKIKETKKASHESPKKPINIIPQPGNFPPTEEIQKYKQLLEILKPYHNNKKRYSYYYCCILLYCKYTGTSPRPIAKYCI